jgi:ATP-dependent RNA helicase DeaD
MVQQLAAEGHDPMNIAAAAIKIGRADERQRPIAEVSEVKSDDHKRGRDPEQRGRREPFGRRGAASSHEEGMVRLKLNKGRMHRIRPNDIVGTIAFHANIPGYTIGKIRIEEKYSFVDIPEDVVNQVLKHSGNYRVGKEKFSLVKA